MGVLERASRRDRRRTHDEASDNGCMARLEEEIGDQEAEQTEPGHDLDGHARLSGSMLLLRCCRRSLGLATCLPLSQSLVCQPVLQSLDLCVRIGKLGLQFVTGWESAGHGGLSGCEGTGGFSGLRRLGLGLLGEIGRRDRQSLVVHVLLAGCGSFKVSTGGGVSRRLLLQDLN